MLDLQFTAAEIRSTRLRWKAIDALREEQRRLERQRMWLHTVMFVTVFIMAL